MLLPSGRKPGPSPLPAWSSQPPRAATGHGVAGPGRTTSSGSSPVKLILDRGTDRTRPLGWSVTSRRSGRPVLCRAGQRRTRPAAGPGLWRRPGRVRPAGREWARSSSTGRLEDVEQLERHERDRLRSSGAGTGPGATSDTPYSTGFRALARLVAPFPGHPKAATTGAPAPCTPLPHFQSPAPHGSSAGHPCRSLRAVCRGLRPGVVAEDVQHARLPLSREPPDHTFAS